MVKETMRRTAADNRYLHKDFHAALNCALEYLRLRFGAPAVSDYLRRFARRFHAPLTAALRERGLSALKDYFDAVYGAEGAEFDCRCDEDELVLRVAACPAVSHIRARGFAVSPLFHETTRAVNEAICDGTPYAFELVSYDVETGRSVQRFCRRRER